METGWLNAEIASLRDRFRTGGICLGDVLCDHATSDAIALVHDGPAGTTRVSYQELQERSMRFAGTLRDLGVEPGDRVGVLLGKSPEILVALLGVWRAGGVHVPLFTAFGPDAVQYRLEHSGAKLLVTDGANRDKFSGSGRVICLGGAGTHAPGDVEFGEAERDGEPFSGIPRDGDDLFVLVYTSGTTGQPKGVEVPIWALASMESYMRHGLGLTDDDVYWNIGDPGWAYGLFYGVIGPLLLGRTTILRSVPFDAEDVFDAIARHGVTNLAGAPTAYRSLRAAGVPADFRERSRLRAISSGGEPLNPELLAWSRRELGVPIHDHYGQSELGMAVYFPHHPRLGRDPVPGSMGLSAPGFRAVVIDDDGMEAPPGVAGQIAIDVGASPLYWFRGYFHEPRLTTERFRHGDRYHLTGDAALVDETGLLHFASRADDIISSSGYRIGPFEVESAMMAHPAVAEVAVVGTPDELRGEAVTAFVVTAPSVSPGPELTEELQEFVKSRLAKHLYPRRVVFVESLPRTPSGKVRRTILRDQWRAEGVSA